MGEPSERINQSTNQPIDQSTNQQSTSEQNKNPELKTQNSEL